MHIDLVAEKGNYFGCSYLALLKLAESMRYRLVALTVGNCFFVRDEDFEKFSMYESSLESLAMTEHINYLITGYDGSYILSQRPTFGFQYLYTGKLIGEYYRPAERSRNGGSIMKFLRDLFSLLTRKVLKR